MDTVFIVLAWYGDGSANGAETVLACFKTRTAADRFVELADKIHPTKTLAVVPMSIEP